MDVPKTTRGSPCKSCKKSLKCSGSFCHNHSEKTSPSNSSPKREEKQEELFNFTELPDPAMYKSLLQMDVSQLNHICRNNNKAKKICNLQRFQEEYRRLHPSMFWGKLRKVQSQPFDVFEDSIGNRVTIRSILDNDIRQVFMIAYEPYFVERGNALLLTTFGTAEGLKFTSIDLTRQKLKYLRRIGHEDWLVGGGMSVEASRQFLNIIIERLPNNNFSFDEILEELRHQ